MNEIIIAIITVAGTMMASFVGIIISGKLTTYRIEQLEKNVEKHNNVIERVLKLEHTVDVIKNKIGGV